MTLSWQGMVGGALAAGIGALIAIAGMGGFSGGQSGGDAIRTYLLAHPEIIPEAMNRLADKQTAQAIEANRAAITTPFPGAVAGNPHGRVTLTEYYDYACVYCRASVGDIEKLIAADPDLRVVYKELPILAPESDGAARMSLAAAGEGKFLPFHRAMYEGGALDAAKVAQTAKQFGVNPAAADTSAIAREIETNLQTARALGIQGTPTFIVGDQLLSGAVGYGALKAAIDKARSGET